MNKHFWHRNGSTILTVVGGIGVVATSVSAVIATPKALRLLEEAKEEKEEELTKLEKIKIAGPVYIPSIVLGVGTLTCIFGANLTNKRSQAALVSAYTLLDSSYKEYKQKVKHIYGEEGEKNIREALAKDQYEETEYLDEYEDGLKLYYDEFSRRYFRATKETVLNAEYTINKLLSQDSYVYLNEWYDLLDVEQVDYGNHIGWSAAQMFDMYWSSWIHFWHEEVDMEDGMECTIIHFTEPLVGFDNY